MINVPHNTLPLLRGLVLAGGRSERMGMDKSQISFRDMPQYQFLYSILCLFTAEVYISCRSDQVFDEEYQTLVDTYQNIGPMAGLLTAFDLHPDSAWLLVACDLPFIDENAIADFIAQRDTQADASFYIDSASGYPEPLFTIFEPSILPLINKEFAAGQTSLNRVLRYCNGNQLIPTQPHILNSANTPEDVTWAKQKLQR